MKRLSIFLLFTFLFFPENLIIARGKQDSPAKKTKDEVSEFSVFFSDHNPNYLARNTDLEKYLTEKTGVRLKWEMTEASPVDYINMMVTSGDYPDMICPKGTVKELIDKGILLDLTELIEKYAPHIKSILGDQINRLRYSQDDTAIYFIPNVEKFNPILFESPGPFHIQLDALEWGNFPRLRTLDDYEALIRQYVEANPTINGKPSLGLSLIAENWRILISVTNPAFQATGASDDGEFYIDPETLEVNLHYKRPEEREYFRWLNHMYNTGLLDPASFIQTYEQYTKKIASGRVVALIDQSWEMNQGVNQLKAKGEYNRLYGNFPITLSKEEKIKVFQQTGFIAGWGIGITTACEDPVKAIQFLDFLSSEEGQILTSWGIEGTHYYYSESGKRMFFPEFQQMLTQNPNEFRRQTDIGNYEISLRYGDGNKDSTGNFFTLNFPEQISSQYSDYEKEIFKRYGIQFWKELYPQESEFPIKPWGAGWNIPISGSPELSLFWDREQEIIYRRIPEAILSTPEEFDKVYDQMLVELEEIGAEKMEEEFAKLVKQRITLWN